MVFVWKLDVLTDVVLININYTNALILALKCDKGPIGVDVLVLCRIQNSLVCLFFEIYNVCGNSPIRKANHLQFVFLKANEIMQSEIFVVCAVLLKCHLKWRVVWRLKVEVTILGANEQELLIVWLNVANIVVFKVPELLLWMITFLRQNQGIEFVSDGQANLRDVV